MSPEPARTHFSRGASRPVEPAELEPLTAIAIGYLGDGTNLDEQYAKRDERPRVRKMPDELVLRGGF